MKTLKLLLLLSAAMILWGCNEQIEYFDALYFTGTEDTQETVVYIDTPRTFNVTVSSSKKMGNDVTVFLEVNTAGFEAFNVRNDNTYELLPAGSYSFPDNSVIIEEGKSVSTPFRIEITSIEDFVDGQPYVVPLRITGSTEDIEILPTSQEIYVIINQVIPFVAPDLVNRNYMSIINMDQDPSLGDLTAATLECRVYVKSFKEANKSNTGLTICSVMGVEESFLLRFGDDSCEVNELQCAGRGASLTSNTQFNTDQWYHIAVVDDGTTLILYVNGEADASLDSSGKANINLINAWDGQPFYIGYSADSRRMFNGVISEARVWRRALTGNELKNGMCRIDPSAATGLVAYWSLNETLEDGLTFPDLSGNGYDAVAQYDITWVDDLVCPDIN